ncbi:L-rhamnose mutarotase [Streptomyces tubercidicus]|uniref:L-rhamnose mutarotase n=1 Tax=Streptomyces tubercidicus TaxID=47759 RepID=UPI002E12651E|nr:L-rhamnose mutarotase [Streptomyces tubercidicus]
MDATRRVAQGIGVRPEILDEYRPLHRGVPPPALDQLWCCHIANYSIHVLGDRLFSYFEYHGDDLASDLARMGADGLVEAHRRRPAARAGGGAGRVVGLHGADVPHGVGHRTPLGRRGSQSSHT